jgi:hypothetical protein
MEGLTLGSVKKRKTTKSHLYLETFYEVFILIISKNMKVAKFIVIITLQEKKAIRVSVVCIHP